MDLLTKSELTYKTDPSANFQSGSFVVGSQVIPFSRVQKSLLAGGLVSFPGCTVSFVNNFERAHIVFVFRLLRSVFLLHLSPFLSLFLSELRGIDMKKRTIFETNLYTCYFPEEPKETMISLANMSRS